MGFTNKNNESLVMVSIKLQMRFRRSRGRPNSLFINPFVFSPPILEAKCSAFTKFVLHFSGITIAIRGHLTRHDFYLCMSKETFVIFIIYKCYNLA